MYLSRLPVVVNVIPTRPYLSPEMAKLLTNSAIELKLFLKSTSYSYAIDYLPNVILNREGRPGFVSCKMIPSSVDGPLFVIERTLSETDSLNEIATQCL